MSRLILASKSPRRNELLHLITDDFEIIPAVGEEILPDGTSARNAAGVLAHAKAVEISEQYPDDIIIGADTVVVLGEEILGKPHNEADAVSMLKKLSGKEHSVFTGVCIRNGSRETVFIEETRVAFYPLSDTEISDYVATGEPMDKAGAYGIQGKGSLFVEKIHGDYFNVMGLPVAKLSRKLGNFIAKTEEK